MSKNDNYAVELAILLLRKMADKMEEEPEFAEQLLEEVKALRKKQAKQLKKSEKTVKANSKSPAAIKKSVPETQPTDLKEKADISPVDLPDIYAVYLKGQEEGLRTCLEGYDLASLRGVVKKNHLDPSGKVIKRKSIPNMITFIVDITKKRLSQGDAFRTSGE